MAAAQPWWKAGKAIEDETFSDWQELRTEDGLVYYFNRSTQETTWDKPAELMTEDEKSSASSWCWVPDETDVYIAARKIEENGHQLIVELESGEERYVNAKDVKSMKQSSLQRIVADLTLLDEMSVPLILHCLRKRFEGGKIYSAIGTILISINPYTSLDLYTPKMIRKYRNSLEEHREVPPHVFVVADQAYKGLTFENGPNQSIIISGESGAGKTEAAKQCLSYLGAVAGSVAGVEKKVFDANPILEGFGNAKTVRNNNSSRFGKYVEIFLNKHLQLMGGNTQNYLLEKVRVGRQADNERNYHIFYMLSKGADRSLRQELNLKQPDNYFYCAQGGSVQAPGINDKTDFDEVKEAFQTLEFNQQDVHSIFRIVAGILHLGNTEYQVVKSNYADDTSSVTDRAGLQVCAKLWKVDVKTLEKGVTHRSLVMPGQKTVEKGLNPDEARDQRDALCKYVYSQIFDWLVKQINASMKPKSKPYKSIGILDIFGFEIFEKNSLEQLCINFCNEKLQQLFNYTVFKLEEKVYKSENIGVDHVPFIDNQPILDMIEQKRSGILPMLDEEGRTPGGSEPKYRQKLNGNHASNKYFRSYGKDDMCFILSHYAGDVVYDVRGFIEKNKDILDKGLLIMLSTAKERMLQTLFKNASKMSAAARRSTLSGQFRTQLNKLMTTLHQTEPHYIRCIKPNEDKEPLYFVPRSCFEQMTYSGVFEAVKIRKGGFPFRLKHVEFANRYRCILEEANKNCRQGKAGCQDVVNHLNLNRQNIREGRTMMLYRAQEHQTLELKRNIIMEKRKMHETLQELINTDPNKLDEPELYYERLARALRSCKRYNISSPLAEKAKKLLMVYIESRIDPQTRQLLDEALRDKDIDKLEEVCVIIEREQYETDRCKLALRMRDRIRMINSESERAAVTLDTNHMEACLFAASELEYTNEYIDYFRWMFDTLGKGSQQFVQEQMRQAVAMQDVKRQIRLNIQLKDLTFAKIGNMFAIANCPILKEVDDWAGEKFLPMGKDKLKAGMMVWTNEEMHSCLTRIDKKLKKQAKDLLKPIQCYMGDRAVADNKTADQYGLEVLLAGHSNQVFRNEVYCQIIKQLTNNPGPNSVNRGWNLLTLCLYIFKPSEELENYLEVFIRNADAERRERTLVALHTIMYSAHGGMQKQPTIKDMQDILSGVRPLRKDFLEEPPEMPSWAPLTRSFYDEDDDADEYFESAQEPLAGAVAKGPKLANNKPMKRHKGSVASPPNAPGNSPAKFNFNPPANKGSQGPPKVPTFAQPKPAAAAAASGGGGPPPFQGGAAKSGGPPPFGGAKPAAASSGPSWKKNNNNNTATTGGASSQPAKKWGGGGAKKAGGGGAIAELQAKLAAQGGGGGGFGGGGAAKSQPSWKQKQAAASKGPSAASKGPSASSAQPAWKQKQQQKKAEEQKQQAGFGSGGGAAKKWGGGGGAAKPKASPPAKQASGYQWLCHLDPESGDVFYENIKSGDTTWDRPPNGNVKPHWIAHLDPESMELYFENIDSGETTWDKPAEFSDPEERWVARKDEESGTFYYEEVDSGKTQWECPDCFKEKQMDQEWQRHFDPNSAEYYYENLKTGETTWDAPLGVQFD